MYAGLSQLVSKYLSTRCWQLRRKRSLNLVLPVGDSNQGCTDNQFILVCRPGCADITDQLAILAKTGATAKRWFGVRVVTAAGRLPSMPRLCYEEGVGCWGLALLIAYLLWRYSGFPP